MTKKLNPHLGNDISGSEMVESDLAAPSTSRKPSRRRFLQTTAAGAVATAVLGAGCSDEAAGDGGDTDSDTSDAGSGNVGDAPINRVVRVIDSGATIWSVGDSFSDFYQYGAQDVVDQMVARGLMALTDTASLSEAWASLIPYRAGDLVAVHLNGFVHNANDEKNNVYQPISAIVHGLVDLLGIPADKVAISDPSRDLLRSEASRARVIAPCRHTDQIAWDLYRGEYGGARPFSP